MNRLHTAAHQSVPHESAHLHVTGSADYVDDMPELHGTLHAALGLSTQAHARIQHLDLSAVLAYPGVVDVLLARDIPGSNQCGPIVPDDPILAEDQVHYVGQPIFAVLAHSREAARQAARLAKVEYAVLEPVLSLQAAHAAQSYVVPPVCLVRTSGTHTVAQKIAAAPHRLQGTLKVGGQEQFYLEGQISYAIPHADNSIHLYCSTQHPSEMQHVLAHALNLRAHHVRVEVRRMGGGFGGKESQSAIFAAIAALAATKLQRPVKLRPDRDDDMMVTGKRHDFAYAYDVGFAADGLIEGVQMEMLARAGFSADLSGPVITRAVCHLDNAYYLADVDIAAYALRTNTQSNTAFRGFGGPQGAIAIETIIDDIARALDLDPLVVRKRNFYAPAANPSDPPSPSSRSYTPYGQEVRDNIIQPLTAELEASSEYAQRRAALRAFNAHSPILKKGIALTPVKFGISFNVPHFNQAGALVHIYTDGSILVNHGGTEMGQGLNTKIAQIVAHELGVDVGLVHCTATDTSKVPNTSATAASTGTDLNGKAAEDAARQIKMRLANLTLQVLGADARSRAEDVRFDQGRVQLINRTDKTAKADIAFTALVHKAYEARIPLWSDGFYATPNIHWNKDTVQGSPFYYFAYGAAVAEVIVDTLTGEWKLLRADLLHDAGRSINPALDKGQVEGAFIQGMGWLTSEELWWNPEGRLMTHAPSTYKIPAIHDCPLDFRTALYAHDNPVDSILRSKAVGEPPLLLAFSVFFALRDAIASLAGYRQSPPLHAPATPEAILNAIHAVSSPPSKPHDTKPVGRAP